MCNAHKALKIYARTPEGSAQVDELLALQTQFPPAVIQASDSASEAVQQTPPQSGEFTVGRALSWLAVGGLVAGATLVAAPYVLPAFGIGTQDMAADAMFMLHNRVGGDGLAGIINQGLEAVPFIGGRLADGGWFNALASGVVGIGGVLLGRSMHDDKSNKARYKLGSLIQYAALATSALIALPTVLTAISSGLIYTGMLAGGANPTPEMVGALSEFNGFIGDTVGTIGDRTDAFMGVSGIAAMTPHYFTCGVSVLPTAVSLGLKHKEKKDAAKKQEKEQAQNEQSRHASFADRVVQRAMPEAGLRLA